MGLENLTYKLPPDILIKRSGEKYLFLNPSAPDWIVTNSNGALALRLCNGRRTIGDIARKLSRKAGRDTAKEIYTFFSEISPSNLFKTYPSESCTTPQLNLHTVHLNLTNTCNLKCIYCYADERSQGKDRLTYEDYLNIVNATSYLSPRVNIVLTGGEPLLKSYALDVAEYAREKGHDVQLLTNGLLINEENAQRIADLFNLVKISLDGSTPEINDFHRGPGSFEKISAAIDLLIQKKASLGIAMTITQKNKHDLGAMAKKFGSLLSIAPLFKAGRAKAHRKLALSGKEYYRALASVEGVNPLSYLCSSLTQARQKRIMKCGMGDGEISISDTGDVYPCHLLHLPQFLAGNVKQQPLETIYQTSERLTYCKELTVLKITGCQKCDVRFICGGACRARAFYEKNRLDVSDDFCKYEKQAFINGLFQIHQIS